jgi:NAD(P)-dependent dehydrogenase (short-subunit alcohol dehydrogenase family)
MRIYLVGAVMRSALLSQSARHRKNRPACCPPATMPAGPFILVAPATRGLSLALARQFLRTTNLPVYATHRSSTPDDVREHILAPLKNDRIDPNRLSLLRLDLTSESSIASASQALSEDLHKKSGPHSAPPYIHTAVFAGGVLHPEKQPADLDLELINHTFQINVISHLLLIKHFSSFLPPSNPKTSLPELAKWIHVSARVGSVSDNRRGGWYSYRASKSALNQVVKTFDLQLQMKKTKAMCVGVHPGTMKTDLSKPFWGGVEKGRLLEPEASAEKLVDVVGRLREDQRGRIWDWEGKEVLP